MLRTTLKKMGRQDLIGNGKMQLIPLTQFSKPHGLKGGRFFRTQHAGLPVVPTRVEKHAELIKGAGSSQAGASKAASAKATTAQLAGFKAGTGQKRESRIKSKRRR